MSTTATDPKTPATKPHGTTDDQIKEMENEGQAQQPAPVDPAEIERSTAAGPQDASSPKRSEFDKTMSDQDIDTAGTDADKA